MPTKRIPIGPGFSLSFLADGSPKANVTGKTEEQIISAVEDWLDHHKTHADAEEVSRWLTAKYIERADSLQERMLDVKREAVDEWIEMNLRNSRLEPKLKEIVRRECRRILYGRLGIAE